MQVTSLVPRFRYRNNLQFKQDTTYLTLQNLTGNGHGIEIEFATGYSKDSYNLVCDLTYTDNLTGISKTIKFDLVAEKGQRLIIPFVQHPDMPYVVVDSVAQRSLQQVLKTAEGYLTSFSIVAYTYISVKRVRYIMLPRYFEAGKLFVTFFKTNLA